MRMLLIIFVDLVFLEVWVAQTIFEALQCQCLLLLVSSSFCDSFCVDTRGLIFVQAFVFLFINVYLVPYL
jgi:hypothetical protein